VQTPYKVDAVSCVAIITDCIQKNSPGIVRKNSEKVPLSYLYGEKTVLALALGQMGKYS
jgi:hypothetical protein